MLSIIYPFRDRDIKRVENSLHSLKVQTTAKFEMVFVDYGSRIQTSNEIENLLSDLKLGRYVYLPTNDQPWNKSRALNYVIKSLETDFCFVADVDMIFHPEFVEKVLQLQNHMKFVYFQVGYLSQEEPLDNLNFAAYRNFKKSSPEATGLTLFPVKALREVRGFDEFYHFWGAEDTDIHVRLTNSGYVREFYDKEILMLHQWHPSYQSQESAEIKSSIQIKGIIRINFEHLKTAINSEKTFVNPGTWGECMSKEERMELELAPVHLVLNNEKSTIDHLLFGYLPEKGMGVVKIIIQKDREQGSLKYSIKKVLGKKVPFYYSLKEINDKILLHLISFYRDRPYIFRVNEEGEKIEFAIKFKQEL